MYSDQAFEQSLKHSSEGVKPSWVKIICVLLFFSLRSKEIVVPVHSLLSLVKFNLLSVTNQLIFLSGTTIISFCVETCTSPNPTVNSSFSFSVFPSRFSVHHFLTAFIFL